MPTAQRLVERSLRTFGDRLALVEGDRRVTYRELEQRTARLANALLGLSAGPYRPAATLLPNSGVFMEVDVACTRAGITRVGITDRLSPDECRYIVADSEAAVLVATPEPAGAARRRPAGHAGARAARRRRLRERASPSASPVLDVAAGRARRPELHPLHERHDRPAEGRHALARRARLLGAEHERHRAAPRADLGDAARRAGDARQRLEDPLVHGRRRTEHRAAALRPRARRGGDPGGRRHAHLPRADDDPAPAGGRAAGRRGGRRARPDLVRRRADRDRALPPRDRGLPREPDAGLRLVRGAAPGHAAAAGRLPRRRLRPRADERRPRGAGRRADAGRRRRRRGAGGRDGRAARARAAPDARLLAQRRGDARGVHAGGVVQPRRPGHGRRGRHRHVPRPQARPDHQRRPQHLSVRGRARHRRASRRARGRRRGRARRRVGRGGRRLRRPGRRRV